MGRMMHNATDRCHNKTETQMTTKQKTKKKKDNAKQKKEKSNLLCQCMWRSTKCGGGGIRAKSAIQPGKQAHLSARVEGACHMRYGPQKNDMKKKRKPSHNATDDDDA